MIETEIKQIAIKPIYAQTLTTCVVASFTFLFGQKSNKKGQPKTKQPVFGKGISIKLWYYCGEGQWNLDTLTIGWLLYMH